MNPLTEVWFWLLIISIIGFIISFVLFETKNRTINGQTSIPVWIWVIYFVSIGLFAAALIIFCYRIYRHQVHNRGVRYGVIPSEPLVPVPIEQVVEEVPNGQLGRMY